MSVIPAKARKRRRAGIPRAERLGTPDRSR